MSRNLFFKINQNISDFSKGHKKIANYIIEHYDKAAYMTAAKLGVTVGVSESTVVRFAAELGYEGYPELQSALQEMARNKLTSVQRIEVTSDQIGSKDIFEKVLNFDIDKIKKTLEESSREEFYGAVDTIINAKRIYIIGARSASALARFMAYYFNLMFENARFINTASESEMFEQIMRIEKEDVMIGISFPRYSSQTAKALQFAEYNGAKVIAITDSKSSPLAEYADNLLLARSDMASFVDSLVAPLSLINALIVAIGIKKRTEVSQNFEKLEDIWDKYDVYEKQRESKD
ncbi:MAG TPA: MurR/RpiR family transcriptional regulator [Oscillospiraceae bacterium]|nr:MurR/RpiR family transcriptional regulator [Oscillospiraceae bacterium]